MAEGGGGLIEGEAEGGTEPEVGNTESLGCFDIAALPRHLFLDILNDFDLAKLISLERVSRSMRPKLEPLWAARSKRLKLYSGKFDKLTAEQMKGLCKRLKNWVEEVVFMPPTDAKSDEVKAYRRRNISSYSHYLENSDVFKAIGEGLPKLSRIDFGFLQLKVRIELLKGNRNFLNRTRSLLIYVGVFSKFLKNRCNVFPLFFSPFDSLLLSVNRRI